ncbi:MAG: hypothetical protein K2N36_05530 [Ruminiclostridium sp.]|nr:hypothetical protein [Ruminiclostridium sp.]
MFDLLFDGKKISSYQQLTDNFDFEAVKLYCLGGSLSSWLDNCGESEIAEKVREIDLYGDIDAQLADIFGQPAPIRVDIQKAQAVNNAKNALSSFVTGITPFSYALAANNGSFLAQAEYSSFAPGSFALNSGSFSNGSFGNLIGSYGYNISSFEQVTGSFGFSTGSFRIGSWSHEYESEYELGSFRRFSASFNFEQSSFFKALNSFGWETASFSYETTSYSLYNTSFNTGSFNNNLNLNLSSFSLSSFSPSSFEMSSFQAGSFGETHIINKNKTEEKLIEVPDTKTPEEKICENLTYSPLNRYGYGIHLI